MSPTRSNDVASLVTNVTEMAKSAISGGTAEDYETLEQHINSFESTLREIEQEGLSNQALKAIRNLEGNKPLTPEDESTIRALVVGDAEHYLKHERDFEGWLLELQRLAQEIERMARSTVNPPVGDMRGLTKDAVRLLPNIRSYMEEKRRLEKFNAAFANLDEGNRKLLVQLLREKLASNSR